jgi:hypothetical protein
MLPVIERVSAASRPERLPASVLLDDTVSDAAIDCVRRLGSIIVRG